MEFDRFFSPRSVAMIGASDVPGKLGYDVLINLINSKVKVYPVNPKHKKIKNIVCYSLVTDIKDKVDLAVIATPAATIPGIIRECGKVGIKNAIIISSGFMEVGNKQLEEDLRNALAETKIAMIGPNCLGVIDCNSKFNGSFYSGVPPKGKLAFISQSGALGVAILDKCIKDEIGLSKFVSVGNSTNISFTELIDYLNNDKETEVIAIYSEDFKHTRSFLETAGRVKKPIFVLKAGRSEEGAKAASTHTAALAVPDKIYDGAFKQFGLKRVNTLNQLFQCSLLAINKNVPSGRKGLIITNAGGPGVLAVDAMAKNNLDVIALPENIVEWLNPQMPINWSKRNPIDVIGDATPERYKAVLDVIGLNKFYDFIFLILTPQTMSNPEEVAKIFCDFKMKYDVPCYACFMGGKLVEKAKEILRRRNIANFEEPSEGLSIISKMVI